MATKTKKFITKIGGKHLKESFPEWEARMKKNKPMYENLSSSLYISEIGGCLEVSYKC